MYPKSQLQKGAHVLPNKCISEDKNNFSFSAHYRPGSSEGSFHILSSLNSTLSLEGNVFIIFFLPLTLTFR